MRSCFFVFVMLLPFLAGAQSIEVNSNVVDNEVVEELLGGGINISNVQIHGGDSSRGIFSNGNIGIESGVVLKSGNVDEITLPFNETASTTNEEHISNHPLIDAVFPANGIHEATIIEFDFTTTRDSLSFEFVFASEEYPEYVCSGFNDLFGFILSENDSTGYINSRNLAKIPGTNDDIAINTINNGEPGSQGDSSNCTSLAYSQYYNTNNSPDFVFDAYIDPFRIEEQVVPGKSYHITMFVSDVMDGSLNSAVFIKGNSFGSEPPDPEFPCSECVSSFSPVPGKKYVMSAWVKEVYLGNTAQSSQNNFPHTYENCGVQLSFNDGDIVLPLMRPSGPIVDGWQRIEQPFTVPANANNISIGLANDGAPGIVYFDDIRMHPFRSNMKSFVYDPSTRRLRAGLDENNYATHYEYDDEGQLIRIRKETERGVMTIQESRQNQSKLHIQQQ